MAIFDGGMFDFNGDGVTDIAEEALGYQILEEEFREEELEEYEDEEDYE